MRKSAFTHAWRLDTGNAPRRGWCARMLACALAIVSAAVATASLADTPARPRPWRTEVGPDKKYVFVMQILSCRPGIRKTFTAAEFEQQTAVQAGRAGSRRACDSQQILSTWPSYGKVEVLYADGVSDEALRTASGVPYPVSGLYRNDGSTKPLWSVHWYSFSADISDDGRYLIRPGAWASSFEDPAIAFYDRGVLLKEYRIGDLVSDRNSVIPSVSHFTWSGGGALDQKSLRYRLKTFAGDRYEFDATTGAIVLQTLRPPPGRPASVEYTDGTHATFTALFSCGALEMFAPGLDPDVFYGQTSEPGPEPNTARISVMAIPLRAIRSLGRADEGAARNAWSVSLLDGSVRSLELDTDLATLCHRDAGGVRTPVAVEKIRSIEFTRDK